MRNSETAARAQDGHAAASPRRPIEETARLGKEIYERHIRSKVEADHHGEGRRHRRGQRRLGHRRYRPCRVGRPARAAPDVVDAWAERVGYRTLIKFRRQFPAEIRVIEGFVNANLEAVVLISIRGPQGSERETDAVIDTGYTGSLTLPPSLVAALELPYLIQQQCEAG